MPRILDDLHTDHRNFARLFRLLEEQLEVLRVGDQEDLHLILDIIDYVENYPDCIHHPREDTIYSYYLDKRGSTALHVESLLEEHQQIRQMTQGLRVEFESLLNEGVLSRAVLIKDLETWLSMQKAHMAMEESTVFPVLERELAEEEWADIEKEIDSRKDPLFGDAVKQSYQGLYARIMA